MINKILYVARKAKGITEHEIAEILNVDENRYKELESGIKRMTSDYADALGELFNAEPECFMTYEYGSMQDLTDTLAKHRSLLDVACKQTDGEIHLAIARMGLEASIAVQENCVLLRENRALEKENQALRRLYEDLKKEKSSKPRKADKSEVSKK